MEFSLSDVTKEKGTLTGNFDEVKKTTSEYKLELRTMKTAKEYAENKISKYLQFREDIETNITSLKERIIKKEK